MNKKTFITLFLCLWTTLGLWAVDASYYSSINEKQDAALRTAITSLIYTKHTTALSYDWSFDNIDIVDGVVLDMYSTCSWTSSQQGHSYSDICDGYNREHTVPQSLFNEKSPQVGDRHHLFLTDGQVNNIRSSYPFGETDATGYFNKYSNGAKALGEFGNASYAYSSSQKVYEPDDQYKGDIARAILYMAVRYATTNECRAYNETSNSYPVTTWNNPMFSGSLSTNYGLSDEAVQTFLKWHREDKVSSKEIARNTGVEAKQGNRNPFVDYPILVEYLWGTKKGEIFYLDNAVGSFSGDFIPGVSDGSASGSAVEKYTITWSKDGNTSTTTEVYEGSRPTPPDAADCDAHRVFKGWTASSTYSGDGSDLMTVQSDFPQATAAATYYAVYADKETSGGGTGSDVEMIAEYSGKGTSGSGSSISATKDGVTLAFSLGYGASTSQVRSYSGGTLTFSSTSTITNIAITTNTSKGNAENVSLTSSEGSYSASETSGTWEGSANNVVLTNADKQVQFTSIVVTIGGGSTTYSNYSTECTTCEKVTITFDANGGEGSMTAQQVCPSTSVNLSSNTFTREHYTFNGWNTKANGTGSSYADKASVNIDANLTLYAQWTEDDKYTVTFVNNGSAYGSQTNYAGESITDIENPSVCEGYTFEGWSTQTYAVDNTAAATIDYTGTIPENGATYYAVYTKTEGGSGGSTKYTYNKVTSTSDIEDGDYLIVYETGNVAFNGALTTLDAASNTISVTLSASGDSVTNFATVDAAKFTITADGGNIKSASNKYIGQGSNANGLTSSDNALANTLSIDNGNFVCVSSGGAYLRYNATSGQERFRYFKSSTYSSQQAIQLYKKVGSNTGGGTTYHTTAPDCTPACTATITVQSPDDAQGTVSFE